MKAAVMPFGNIKVAISSTMYEIEYPNTHFYFWVKIICPNILLNHKTAVFVKLWFFIFCKKYSPSIEVGFCLRTLVGSGSEAEFPSPPPPMKETSTEVVTSFQDSRKLLQIHTLGCLFTFHLYIG